VLPLPESVPVLALPFVTPSTLQATEVLEDPETVAVKEVAAPEYKLVEVGLRATLTPGGGATTVITAESDSPGSAWLVALRVWFPAEFGAV
jgi:hypothetical protein